MYQKLFKRLIDIFVSLLLLSLVLPITILVFIFIKLDSSGPLFFKQERIGKNLRLFQVFKFRTMTRDGGQKLELNNRLIDSFYGSSRTEIEENWLNYLD